MKLIALVIFSLIAIVHLASGIGAGWAIVRLWYYRKHPLMGKIGLYMWGFVIEVMSGLATLFVAKGVMFTWTYATVYFTGMLLSALVRVPLIVLLIRGANWGEMPGHGATSGDLPPEVWMDHIRLIIREELAASKT
jgi:hypothetical protein